MNKIRKSRWGHDTFCSNDTKKIYITIKLDEFNKSSFNRHKVFYLGEGLLNTELYGSWDYDVFLPYNVDISKENIKNGGV